MIRTPSRHHRGQTIVEFALLVPLMLLLSVVALDLGRGIYYYSVVYNAAREGARYGIIKPDDFTGIDRAARNLAIGLDQSQFNVSTYILNGSLIEVSVTYNFQLVTPIANLVTESDQYTLRSTSTMSIEK